MTCWEPGFQAWAQSTCPELPAQGLVPLRWGCALPSPNAPGSPGTASSEPTPQRQEQCRGTGSLPGPLFEGNPVGEGTTRRGTLATSCEELTYWKTP